MGRRPVQGSIAPGWGTGRVASERYADLEEWVSLRGSNFATKTSIQVNSKSYALSSAPVCSLAPALSFNPKSYTGDVR